VGGNNNNNNKGSASDKVPNIELPSSLDNNKIG